MAKQQTIKLANGLTAVDAYHVILEEYDNKIARQGTFMLYSFATKELRDSVTENSKLSELAIRKKLYTISDNAVQASNVSYLIHFVHGMHVKLMDGDTVVVEMLHDVGSSYVEEDIEYDAVAEDLESFVARLDVADEDIHFTLVDLESGMIKVNVSGRYSAGAGASLNFVGANFGYHYTSNAADYKASDYDTYISVEALDIEGANQTKGRYEWLTLNDPEMADAIDLL